MTFNIRGGLGMDGPRDTTRIADLVNDENPDIVCFQEVHQRLPWSGWIDQPGRLTVGLRMPFVFQANLRVGFGGYGLGIATHYPIFSVARHRLPSRKEQRGALTILLETPHGPVNITCTHWGLDQDERRSQAAALTDILKNTTGPNIVCGDFNELTSVDYLQNFLAQNGLLDADSAQDRRRILPTILGRESMPFCTPPHCRCWISDLSRRQRPITGQLWRISADALAYIDSRGRSGTGTSAEDGT